MLYKISSSAITMRPTQNTYLTFCHLWLIFVAFDWSQNVQGKTCKESGWFGSNCQYKCHCCHCYSIDCDDDGVCKNDVCERGWFGPGCQFQDLVYFGATLDRYQSWLNDSDINTCNKDQTSQKLVVNLTSKFLFTWLRLQVKEPSLLQKVEVSFRLNDGQSPVGCKSMRSATVNERTLDVHCDLDVTAQFVILIGEGVKSLCSLYISGGRNVALRQNASQSSSWVKEGPNKPLASNAVDGNTNNDFNKLSCSHTDDGDQNPTWNLTLSQEHRINRYVLYNRAILETRLQNFTLTSFTKDNRMVVNHTDTEEVPPHVYTITTEQTAPVSVVSIQSDKKAIYKDKFLTLCEVELYGDSVCPPSKYGRECQYTCNCAIKNESCFVSTGGCPSGCPAGFHGESCNQPCDAGKYGKGCRHTCSQFCNMVNTSESSCHHINGTCLYGCQSGYQTPKCDLLIPDEHWDIAIVVGVTLTFSLAIFAITGFFFWRRHTSLKKEKTSVSDRRENQNIHFKNKYTLQKVDLMLKEHLPNVHEIESTSQSHSIDEIYCNTVSRKSSTLIDVAYLSRFVASKDRNFFQNQFYSIPDNINAALTAGTSEGNKPKNRCKNIFAYDHSRAQLKINSDKNHEDYINASYVDGYKRQQTFIASQSPTKTVLEDFIRMISEQGVEVVVMLTNLAEDGKSTCARYWPEDGVMQTGDKKIRLTTTQVFADYTIRRLQLLQVGQPVQTLTQLHFTSWPDKDVPTTAWSLVDFEQRVASISTDKPIVVHCSDGVGRTGIFIALHNVLKQAMDTGYIDFFTTVQKLRQDRTNMVQNVDQYVFLHRAAQVAIVCMGTTIMSSSITEMIQALEKTSEQGQSRLQLEFEAVCSICNESTEEDKEKNMDTACTTYENSQSFGFKLKNRFSSTLPMEDYRVILTGSDAEDFSNYINAVFLPSLCRKNQNILTQLPLPTTVTDFWRMVIQYKVALVVAFQVDLIQDDSSIGNYLPSIKNKELSVSCFKIKPLKTSSGSSWRKHKLVITTDTGNTATMPGSSISGKKHRLTHLTFTGALTDRKPEDLLTLMEVVRSFSPAGDERTVYMCRNGAEFSGLACILSLLLDRLDNDQCLTVPLVVGAVKAVRPQVIPTVHQYKLLYQVLKSYNDSNHVYSNF